MKIPFSVYDFFGYLGCGFMVLCAVDYGFNGGWLLRNDSWPVYVAFWTVLAYITGHVIANISSFLLEQKFLRQVLISPEETLFDEQKRKGFWPALFPIFYKPFPKETRDRVLAKAKKAGIENPGRGLFFHCHALVIGQKHTSERLSTFLNLYGFSRNISMSGLLASSILALGIMVCGFSRPKMWWIIVALAVSVGMFYRYLVHTEKWAVRSP
jgi:hypothetical protein